VHYAAPGDLVGIGVCSVLVDTMEDDFPVAGAEEFGFFGEVQDEK
jgi:hypothetical protein